MIVSRRRIRKSGFVQFDREIFGAKKVAPLEFLRDLISVKENVIGN
jgi:hypothetical protein